MKKLKEKLWAMGLAAQMLIGFAWAALIVVALVVSVVSLF
jgi:hypothetical protein